MKIFVEGLEITAFHGITEAERAVGQRVRIDLTAEVNETASQTDQIEHTLDYAAMAQRAADLCNSTPNNTLEFACERIGQALLSENQSISSITVRLAKIHPPLPLSVVSVGVEKLFARAAENTI